MHQYESHILKKMMLGDVLRYRDLKLKDIESNLFIYHLKNLIKKGIIKKTIGGYKFTAAGLRYVDKISLSRFKQRFQPKIVNIIIVKNKKEEYLLYFSKRQPFYGLIGFPFGKIHFGEKLIEAANRELKEKTGILAEIKHKGDVYLRIYKDKELMSHMLCHIFLAYNLKGDLLNNSEIGTYKWENIKNIKKIKFIPGFLEMAKLAEKSKTYFFKEMEFNIG